MPRLRYRSFRTRGVYINYNAFRKTLAEGYRTELFPLVVREAHAITDGWAVQVDWDQDIIMDAHGITHNMYPSPGTPGERIWNWLTNGVAGHMIVVRKRQTYRGVGEYKPALKLRRYRPFTAPGGFWGGPGSYYGPTGYRQAVWWTGIAARNFEEQLGVKIAPEYVKITEKWMRRAVKAAQKEGR